MDRQTELIDRLEELKALVAAVREMTQQTIDMSGYPDEREKMYVIDTARIATEEKLVDRLQKLEYFLCYGVKSETGGTNNE